MTEDHGVQFSRKMSSLQTDLQSAEAELNQLCQQPLPGNAGTVHNLITKHREWENQLQVSRPATLRLPRAYVSTLRISALLRSVQVMDIPIAAGFAY